MCHLLQRGRGGGVQGDNVQGGGGRSAEIDQVIANQRQLTLTMTDMRYAGLFSASLISYSSVREFECTMFRWIKIAFASNRISMFYATIAEFSLEDTSMNE